MCLYKAEDKKLFTPLHLACKYGNSECAELLVAKLDHDRLFYTCVSDDVTTPLHLVCRNKNERVVIMQIILEKLAEAVRARKQIFHNYVEFALKKEDQNRQTLLNNAVESNHLKIVEILLKDYGYFLYWINRP